MTLIKETTGERVHVDHVPLEPPDQQTMQLVRSGQTLAMFQIESPGQWHLVAQTQPDVPLQNGWPPAPSAADDRIDRNVAAVPLQKVGHQRGQDARLDGCRWHRQVRGRRVHEHDARRRGTSHPTFRSFHVPSLAITPAPRSRAISGPVAAYR